MNFFNKFDKLNNHYKDRKFILLSLFLGLFGIFFVTVGSSYAYITYQDVSDVSNTIKAGVMKVTFNDLSDGITLDNAMPQKDDDAIKNNNSHDFKIINESDTMIKYKIYLKDICKVSNNYIIGDETETVDKCIPFNYIKAAVKIGDSDYVIKTVSEDGYIYLSDEKMLDKREESKQISIKLWLSIDTPNEYAGVDDDGNRVNSVSLSKIEVYGEQIVSSVTTSNACFEISDEGFITDYNCYYGNEDLDNIKYVVIPSKINDILVEGISDNAFSNKAIDYISIPSSVTFIGNNAFSGNEYLEEIVFTDRTSLDDVTYDENSIDLNIVNFEG